MALWLYPISERANRFFELGGGRIKVSVDNYKILIQNGRLKHEWWYVTQNYSKVQRGDVVYVYTGDKNLGIIGYATVQNKRDDNNEWDLYLKFDLTKCRMLIAKPISAKIVRQWIHYPRNAVRSLEPLRSKIERLLP